MRSLRLGGLKILPVLMMLILLLLAAAVRFHQLEAQSFWYDEGVTYGHSQRTLAELIPALQSNVHVPAYFGLLALYEDFAGSSEFALRSLSVLFSLISIAFTYLLGKHLYGTIAGLAAALFVTLNTFSIHYAQEARMYAMLAAIGTASMWVFLRFWQPQSTLQTSPSNPRHPHPPTPSPLRREGERHPLFKYGLALGIINIIGIYTHFSYALVMLAQGVLAILILLSYATDKQVRREAGKLLVAYTLANLLTVLVFLPWLFTAIYRVSVVPNYSEATPLPEMLAIIQGWLAVGNTYLVNTGNAGVIIYFLLVFGLMLFPEQQPRAWWRMLLPVVWVVISVAGYLYMELYARYLRFLLPAQIGLALWLGRGVWLLWHLPVRENRPILKYMPQLAAVVAVIMLAGNLAGGLTPLYEDPAFRRDNYRGVARAILQEAQPGDSVIISAPGLRDVFGYYYDSDVPLYALPDGTDLTTKMQTIIDESHQIFAVLYGNTEQDPDGIIENTLNQQTYQISDEWWGDIRLVRYVTPANFEDVIASDAQFGTSITLEAYALSSESIKRGDVLQVQLMWKTDATLETRYKVFVQLLDENGVLVAQRDSEPGGGKSLTTDWQVGQTITDNHALAIPNTLESGAYTLIMGLYDANDGTQRLPVNTSDSLTIGNIQVE